MSEERRIEGTNNHLLNMELLDPLLEAMIEGVIVNSGGNVSVEFNFLPFVVDEDETDHLWSPGPMDLDDGNEEEKEEETTYYYEEGPDYEDDTEIPEGEGGGEEEEEMENNEENNNHDEEEEYENENEDYSSQYEEGEEEDDEDESLLEEEEEDGITYSINPHDSTVVDNYGTFGWIIYRNLARAKIYDVNNSNHFLRQMIDYLLINLKQEGKQSCADALLKLLNCLPSFKDLGQIIKNTKYTLKEAMIIKIVLEIYENYHRRYNSPTFTIYQQEVIPVLLDFYNRLTDNALKMINVQMKKILASVKDYDNEFQLFNTRQEYVTHYKNVTRRLCNLCECSNTSHYLR